MEPSASQPFQAPFPIKVLQPHSCGPQLQPDSTGGLALKTNLLGFLFRSLVKMRPRPSTGETFVKQLVCFPEPHGGAPLEGSLSYLEENWGSPLIAQPHPWGIVGWVSVSGTALGPEFSGILNTWALRLVFPPASLLYD